MRRIIWVAAMLSLSGCATYKNDNKPLSEFPGIQSQIMNYYDNNATEEDWYCDAVQMQTIDDSKVTNQSPTQVKMAVTYYFTSLDEEPGRGGEHCQGFNTRFFTFDRSAGGLTLASMSGPQRQP